MKCSILIPIYNEEKWLAHFVGRQSKRILFFWHFQGNKLLTLTSNIIAVLDCQ